MRKRNLTKRISLTLGLIFCFQNIFTTNVAFGESNKTKTISDDISVVQMNSVLLNTDDEKTQKEADISQDDMISDFQNNTKMSSKLPQSYDLRDDGYVTSVKDQGSEGLCWAYSTLGSAESNILSQNIDYPDSWDTDGELTLSVGHLGWFPFTSDAKRDEDAAHDLIIASAKGSTGGNSSIAMAALASGQGGQIESVSPTSEFSSGYSEYQRFSSAFRLNSSQFLSKTQTANDIETIKSWIYENGAVDVSYYNDSSYYTYNDGNTAYYQTYFSGEKSNHEVSIVGWDDNFSASNFRSDGGTPLSSGAWLIKNSWGTGANTEGYMWISYYEPSLTSFTQFIMERADTTDNIIQYDGITCVNAYNFQSVANVFRAETAQSLKSIGFYIYNDLSSAIWYEAKIYLLDDGYQNPQDGTLVKTLSGTAEFTGYKQVALSSEIALKKGQSYSIVMSYRYGSSEGRTAYCAIEEDCKSSWCVFDYSSNAGETYIVENGQWEDAYGYSGKYGQFGNVPIKAYTDETSRNSLIEAKDTLSDAISRLESSTTSYTTLSCYKQAQQILASNVYSCSPQMLYMAADNIYAYLEQKGKIKFPENAVRNVILGDNNDDFKSNSSDAVNILRAYANALTGKDIGFSYKQEKASDVNGDGKINSIDAVIVLRYYANQLISSSDMTVEQYLKKIKN
jgi:C1A family cysteine protease